MKKQCEVDSEKGERLREAKENIESEKSAKQEGTILLL